MLGNSKRYDWSCWLNHRTWVYAGKQHARQLIPIPLLSRSVLLSPSVYIIVRLIALYIALFSALSQTHCALVACDSCSLFIMRCLLSTEVVYLQRYFVVTWLMPRETAAVSVAFCVHHTTTYQFTVSLHSKPHT